MKKDNSPVHVRISEPTKLRRSILEGAIEAAEALKIYERFKAIRKEKKRQEKELKEIIKALKNSLENLEGNLPQINYGKKHEPKKVITPKEVKEIKIPIQPKPEPKSQLDLDLEEIKRKLNRL